MEYDQVAARYDEDRERFVIPPDDILEKLTASRRDVRVLDLGCGTGRWLAAQQDAFRGSRLALLGADPSSAMLAEARAKGLPNLIRAQAEDLPLNDATIDYVACSYCFHHFSDKHRALDEVSRVLASGGLLRLTNIEPTGAEGWWVYVCFPETVAIDAARFWAPSRIAEVLEARDLTVEIRLDAGREEISAADALADAERRVVSELALLDDTAYQRGLAGLRRTAEDPAATMTTTHSRLHVTARRSTR